LFVTVERNQDKAAGIVLPSADEATAGRTPAMAARVGDYLLFETLGTGAFGTVRAAVHAPTGDQVAIKVLDKAVVRHTETALNVRREIAISKALDHPNVVRLRAVLSSATRIYVVLDLVRGKDLYYVIAAKGDGGVGVPAALSYFSQLVVGVLYCHMRGVVHRDLKPENILIDDIDGTLKIADFGMASITGADTAEELLHTLCGTPAYVAPEVLQQRSYSGEKVDAWACGIILFALLAGYLPFDEPDMHTLFRSIQAGTVHYPPCIPALAVDLISRLLDTDPKSRYSIAQAQAHPWLAPTRVPAPLHSPPAEKRRRRHRSSSNPRRRPRTSPSPSLTDPDASQSRPSNIGSSASAASDLDQPTHLEADAAADAAVIAVSSSRRKLASTGTSWKSSSANRGGGGSADVNGLASRSLLRKGVVNYDGVYGFGSESDSGRTLGGVDEALRRGVVSVDSARCIGADGADGNGVADDAHTDNFVALGDNERNTFRALRTIQTAIAVSKRDLNMSRSSSGSTSRSDEEEPGILLNDTSARRRTVFEKLVGSVRPGLIGSDGSLSSHQQQQWLQQHARSATSTSHSSSPPEPGRVQFLAKDTNESLDEWTTTLKALRQLRANIQALDNLKGCEEFGIVDTDGFMSPAERKQTVKLLSVWESRLLNSDNTTDAETSVSDDELLAFQQLCARWDDQIIGSEGLVREVDMIIPGSVEIVDDLTEADCSGHMQHGHKQSAAPSSSTNVRRHEDMSSTDFLRGDDIVDDCFPGAIFVDDEEGNENNMRPRIAGMQQINSGLVLAMGVQQLEFDFSNFGEGFALPYEVQTAPPAIGIGDEFGDWIHQQENQQQQQQDQQQLKQLDRKQPSPGFPSKNGNDVDDLNAVWGRVLLNNSSRKDDQFAASISSADGAPAASPATLSCRPSRGSSSASPGVGQRSSRSSRSSRERTSEIGTVTGRQRTSSPSHSHRRPVLLAHVDRVDNMSSGATSSDDKSNKQHSVLKGSENRRRRTSTPREKSSSGRLSAMLSLHLPQYHPTERKSCVTVSSGICRWLRRGSVPSSAPAADSRVSRSPPQFESAYIPSQCVAELAAMVKRLNCGASFKQPSPKTGALRLLARVPTRRSNLLPVGIEVTASHAGGSIVSFYVDMGADRSDVASFETFFLEVVRRFARIGPGVAVLRATVPRRARNS
jgi:serine/threonine protein kinase